MRRHARPLLLVTAGFLAGCAPDLKDPPFIEPLDGPVAPFAQGEAFRIEGTGTRSLESISAGPAGSALLAGSFEGTLSLGGANVVSGGAEDAFVGFLDTNGGSSLLWSLQAPEHQRAKHAILGEGAGLLIAAEFSGNIALDGLTMQSGAGRDGFAALVPQTDATTEWRVQMGGAGYESATTVAHGSEGSILVGGIFSGVMTLGATAGPTSVGGYDVFLARLDPLSMMPPSMPMVFGGSGNEDLKGMAAGKDGSSCLVGEFEASMVVGAEKLTSDGPRSVFVAWLDPEGALLRALSLGGTGAREAAGIALDGAGNALIAGSFSGSLEACEAELVTEAEKSVFVLKLDSAGKCLWARSFGEMGLTSARGIAVGPSGDVWVAADFTGRVTVGNRVLASRGKEDVLVLKLDASGKVAKVGAFGDAGSQRAKGVAVDWVGRAVVIGHFEGKLDAGASSIESAGSGDPFVLRVK